MAEEGIVWDDEVEDVVWDDAPVVEAEPTTLGAKDSFIADQAKKGLADMTTIVGLPVDVASKVVLNAAKAVGMLTGKDDIGEVDTPFFTMDAIRRTTESAMGVKDILPEDDTERAVGTIARFAAGNAIPAGYLVKMAPTTYQKLAVGLSEAASAVLGGYGMTSGGDTAAEFGEEYRGYGETVGALVGSLTPVLGTSAVLDSVNRLKSLRSAEFQKELGKAQAAATIQQELDTYQQGVRNLNKSQNLSKNIPGYSPSLGRATDSPLIKSLETRLAEESSANLAQAAHADKVSRMALNAKLRRDFPKATVNITNAPNRLLKSVTSDIQFRIDKIKAERSMLERSFLKGDSEQIGARLQNLRNQQEELTRGIKNVKYNDLYSTADNVGFTARTDDLFTEAQKITGGDANRFQSQSSVFNQIMKEYSPSDATTGAALAGGSQRLTASRHKEISFQELHSLVRRTNREYYGTQDPSLKAGLGQLKSFLSKKIDAYKDVEQYGVVATKLREADDYWLNEYQNVFKKGAGARLDASNKYGSITAEENIVENIFLKRADGMDQFKKIYGDSAEAERLLHDGIVDVFARKVKKGGEEVINPTAAYNFFATHDAKLKKVPELYASLKDRVSAIELLAKREAIQQGKIKALNQSRLAQLTGMRDNSALVKKAVEDRRAMGAFIKSVKNPEVRRSVIADHIIAQSDPYKYLLDNLDSVKIGMGGKGGREHLLNLKRLAEGTTELGRTTIPARVETSLIGKDPVERRIGTSIKSIFSQFRAASQGRVSQEYIISDILGKAIFKVKQDQANRLLQDAFYDPELASHLAKLDVSSGVKIPKNTISFLKNRIALSTTEALLHAGDDTPEVD